MSTTGVAPSGTIKGGKSTMAVNQLPTLESAMQTIQKANKRMLAEKIATNETFLERTSMLILADDWFGKWVEKFLKVCNKIARWRR